MTQELQIVTFEGVRGYVDGKQVAWLNVEDVARGLGFTQTQIKSGKEYTSIRWETVNRYLAEFGFPNKLGKDDYIPEHVFYLLAMKASNEAARNFQLKIATEILPSIRKHGFYATPEKVEEIVRNPEVIHRALDNGVSTGKNGARRTSTAGCRPQTQS